MLDRAWWRRLGLTLVGVGVGLAAWGLVDVYLVPLDWWRDSGVPGWFGEQLGLAYRCLSGLPENWILNTDEESPARRLVSTFLSPLATRVRAGRRAAPARRARDRDAGRSPRERSSYAGLLWTHTRAAFLALPVGLARARRAPTVVGAGRARRRLARRRRRLRRASSPRSARRRPTPQTELACLRDNAAVEGEAPATTRSRRARARPRATCARSATASARSPTTRGASGSATPASPPRAPASSSKAGESTYTELGVDTGVLGLAAFVGWLVALFLALRRRSPWLAASVAAVAVLGLQTDVIGIHWLVGRGLRARGRGAPPRRRATRRPRARPELLRAAPRQEAPEPKLARRSTSASSTMWPSRPT